MSSNIRPYKEFVEQVNVIDSDSGEVKSSTLTSKIAYSKPNDEPKYIKIYYEHLFTLKPAEISVLLYIGSHMTYADATSPSGGQIAIIRKQEIAELEKTLGIGRSSYYNALKALCTSSPVALKKIDQTTYQVNPYYISRGSWRYNAQLQSGGVRELLAYFTTGEKETIAFADDGRENAVNEAIHTGIDVKAKNKLLISEIDNTEHQPQELQEFKQFAQQELETLETRDPETLPETLDDLKIQDPETLPETLDEIKTRDREIQKTLPETLDEYTSEYSIHASNFREDILPFDDEHTEESLTQQMINQEEKLLSLQKKKKKIQLNKSNNNNNKKLVEIEFEIEQAHKNLQYLDEELDKLHASSA